MCKAPAGISYQEFRVAALQEQPVGTVPVAIDDVRLPVAVEVSQRYSSAMLRLVSHTCRKAAGL